MKIFEFDTVSSTMDVALELVPCQALPFLVTAKFQRSGRGRGNNVWKSVSDGFYGTFVFNQPQRILDGLSIYIGYSILVKLGLFKAYLKWPNDLLTSDLRKFGGILIEIHEVESKNREPANSAYNSRKNSNRSKVLLVGIGLNLEVDDHTIGTVFEAGFVGSRKELTDKLVDAVLASIIEFQSEHFELPIESIWSRMCLRDSKIWIESESQNFTCVGINEHGHLMCVDEKGKLREIVSATGVRLCE